MLPRISCINHRALKLEGINRATANVVGNRGAEIRWIV